MDKDQFVSLTIQGTKELMQPVMDGFLRLACKRMEEADSLEKAKELWENCKPFHKLKEFREAKERAKTRLTHGE